MREDNFTLLVKDIRGLEDMFLICFLFFLLVVGGVWKGKGREKAKSDDWVVEEVEEWMESMKRDFSVTPWLKLQYSRNDEHKRS